MKGSSGSVLAFLEKNRGTFVSGEQMAEALGISRNGIWKAIQNLRKQGYQIEAITRKGYCLPNDSDILSEQGIRSFLNDQKRIPEIAVYSETESTNVIAQQMAISGKPGGCLVAAAAQTAGKAHNNRGFISPEGGLYISLLLRREDIPFENIKVLVPAAALAVKEQLDQICNINADIVGINDIYDEGKKIGGILTEVCSDMETDHISWVVLGIGVNVPVSKRNALAAGIAEAVLTLQSDEEYYYKKYQDCVKEK